MTHYKKLPLDKKAIEQMKISTPQMYNDMVLKYGEENVINNLLIDLVILTEDKDIVMGKDNQTIKVDKDLIYKVRDSSNGIFQKYITEPINKMKSWITDNDTTLGYTPMISNHEDKVENRYGYILGGSYKAISLKDKAGQDKLHLLCKAILVSPEAKFKHLNGEYREVSPTISPRYTLTKLSPTRSKEDIIHPISEVSYVNVPAQMTNTSLSSNEELIIEKHIGENSIMESWESKIEAARNAAIHEAEQFKIQQKDSIAHNIVEDLIKKGVITSSQRNRIKDMFIQLSAGEENLVAKALFDVKKSPINNKPRQVFIQGNLYMNKSIDERFLEFSKQEGHKYNNGADLRAAFEKEQIQQKVSLSAGEGSVTDPMEDVVSRLSALQESGALTDEHKKILSKFCGHDNMSLEGSDNAVGDGKVTTAGDIVTPNNTSLSGSAKTLEAQDNLVEILQKGFESEKQRANAAEAALLAEKAKLAQIQQTLGV